MDSTLFSLFIIGCAAILCIIQAWELRELIMERRKEKKAARAQRAWESQFDEEWQGVLRAIDGSQTPTTKDHRPL